MKIYEIRHNIANLNSLSLILGIIWSNEALNQDFNHLENVNTFQAKLVVSMDLTNTALEQPKMYNYYLKYNSLLMLHLFSRTFPNTFFFNPNNLSECYIISRTVQSTI